MANGKWQMAFYVIKNIIMGKFTLRQLNNAIASSKKKLVRQAQRNGFCEIFGDMEIRKLKEKFIPVGVFWECWSNHDEWLTAIRAVDSFAEWCQNLNINELKQHGNGKNTD